MFFKKRKEALALKIKFIDFWLKLKNLGNAKKIIAALKYYNKNTVL
jgi:hypothetical protein